MMTLDFRKTVSQRELSYVGLGRHIFDYCAYCRTSWIWWCCSTSCGHCKNSFCYFSRAICGFAHYACGKRKKKIGKFNYSNKERIEQEIKKFTDTHNQDNGWLLGMVLLSNLLQWLASHKPIYLQLKMDVAQSVRKLQNVLKKNMANLF